MSHWYSGWKIWPDSPQGPVDDDYHQIKWLRPYRPGFPRLFLTSVGLVVVLIPMFLSVVALLDTGTPVVQRLLVSGAFGLIAFGIGSLTGRLFAAGVYVNDAGIRLATIRKVQSIPWQGVADVSNSTGRTPLLGLPFARVAGELVVVTTPDSGPAPTPVTSTGLDFFGRSEAYDAAALAIERWWRDAGSEARAALDE